MPPSPTSQFYAEQLLFDYIMFDNNLHDTREFTCYLASEGHPPALHGCSDEDGLDADTILATYAACGILEIAPPSKIEGLSPFFTEEEQRRWTEVPGNVWCLGEPITATVLLG